MVTVEHSKDFLLWYAKLQQLVMNSESQWLVSASPEKHLAGYRKGLSPEDELAELDEMAQWRGCGCGGG